MTATRPLSLVTGASAGIGEAFARALAGLGHDLVLVARRRDRLQGLADELQRAQGSRCHVFAVDLADPLAPQSLCAELASRGLEVDWLINNAGYGLPGTLVANPWKAHADFVQVMMTAPTELAWRLLPGMRERRYGRVINVASLAGFVPGTAGHTLYAASKAYLIKLSQSLTLENRDAGVHVSALCPGFTWSEFHDVTGTRQKMNAMPGFMWLTADEVARQGIEAVERGAVVYVPGRINRMIKAITEAMPDRLALWLSHRQSGRYRNHHD
ncbi:MAG TPA: SDR family oxidoreductase [Dyella sp.]|nr:SDR family oxidoreductase [Dyella sp.]